MDSYQIDQKLQEFQNSGTFLDLSGLGLKTVPEQLKDIERPISISLSRNKLEEIPEWLYYIAIDSLDLSKNPIKNLPDIIHSELSLKYLDISDCLISQINENQIPSSLQILKVANNKIKNVSGVKDLQKIKVIDLSGNELDQSGIFNSLPITVERVNLSSNRFSLFSADPTELNDLQYLDLSGNRLTEIQGSQWIFPNLLILKVGENLIERVTIQGFSLQELWAQDNQMRDFPFQNGDFRRLRKLVLSKNNINNIPSSLAYLSSLEQLWLDRNEIEHISKDAFPKSLYFLSLNYNPTIDLEGLEFYLKLRDVPIGSTPILDIPPSDLSFSTFTCRSGFCFQAKNNELNIFLKNHQLHSRIPLDLLVEIELKNENINLIGNQSQLLFSFPLAMSENLLGDAFLPWLLTLWQNFRIKWWLFDLDPDDII
ncbi:MAG: leucine-rich repeat domain-containing protein [Bacteroidia bacterium]|nr:leucine-rich repeat domain-containing protein [Bacteroidia bacterium]